MQDGACNHDIGRLVWKAERFDGLDAEIARGKPGRELRRERADLIHCGRIAISSRDVVAVSEQVDEVAPAAAAGVNDVHARGDTAAQQLIEQVDVDVAELFLQVRHWFRVRGSRFRVRDSGSRFRSSV